MRYLISRLEGKLAKRLCNRRINGIFPLKKAISLRADILINRGGGSFETHTPACPNGYSKWSIRFNNVIISSSSFKTQTGVLRRLKR